MYYLLHPSSYFYFYSSFPSPTMNTHTAYSCRTQQQHFSLMRYLMFFFLRFSRHFFAPSLFIHTHTQTHALGKLTGWHTAVLNISGSFLLGAVYAVPTIETKTHSTTNTKITSQHPSWMNLIRDPWGRIQQGITPRTKLMWGVGFCGR